MVVVWATVYTLCVRYVGSDHSGGKEPLRDVSKHILPSKAPVEIGTPSGRHGRSGESLLARSIPARGP